MSRVAADTCSAQYSNISKVPNENLNDLLGLSKVRFKYRFWQAEKNYMLETWCKTAVFAQTVGI